MWDINKNNNNFTIRDLNKIEEHDAFSSVTLHSANAFQKRHFDRINSVVIVVFFLSVFFLFICVFNCPSSLQQLNSTFIFHVFRLFILCKSFFIARKQVLITSSPDICNSLYAVNRNCLRCTNIMLLISVMIDTKKCNHFYIACLIYHISFLSNK